DPRRHGVLLRKSKRETELAGQPWWDDRSKHPRFPLLLQSCEGNIAATPPNRSRSQVLFRHLRRYLNEFSCRFKNRKDANPFGMTVHRMVLAGNLPYESKASAATSILSDRNFAHLSWS